MKKKLNIVRKIFPGLLAFAFTAAVMLSCKNSDKKDAKSNDTTTVQPTQTVASNNQMIINDLYFPELNMPVTKVSDVGGAGKKYKRILFQFIPLNANGAIDRFGLIAYRVDGKRSSDVNVYTLDVGSDASLTITTKAIIFGTLELTNTELASVIGGHTNGFLIFKPKPDSNHTGYVIYSVSWSLTQTLDAHALTSVDLNPSPPATPNDETR